MDASLFFVFFAVFILGAVVGACLAHCCRRRTGDANEARDPTSPTYRVPNRDLKLCEAPIDTFRLAHVTHFPDTPEGLIRERIAEDLAKFLVSSEFVKLEAAPNRVFRDGFTYIATIRLVKAKYFDRI